MPICHNIHLVTKFKMDILAFSGNVNLMEFVPEDIIIGHNNNQDINHKVIKGNWELNEKNKIISNAKLKPWRREIFCVDFKC